MHEVVGQSVAVEVVASQNLEIQVSGFEPRNELAVALEKLGPQEALESNPLLLWSALLGAVLLLFSDTLLLPEDPTRYCDQYDRAGNPADDPSAATPNVSAPERVEVNAQYICNDPQKSAPVEATPQPAVDPKKSGAAQGGRHGLAAWKPVGLTIHNDYDDAVGATCTYEMVNFVVDIRGCRCSGRGNHDERPRLVERRA